MNVKYLDLIRQFDDPSLMQEITSLFKKCDFILGDKVKEFEEAFAKYCDVKYAVGVNSGTDAILLALKVLNIGMGDEVITVPNSFIATAATIVLAGAKPVFVDVADDYNIHVKMIEKAITPKTRAIIPVHLTGNPADMDSIMEIAKKHGLYVIEDAAQSIGAVYKNKKVGGFGDFGAFSLHPLKNLNVAGDGGVITTNSEEMYKKLTIRRNHGLINRNECIVFSYNSRLDTIQAIIALYNLNNVESIQQARRKNAKVYDDLFSSFKPEWVRPPVCSPDTKPVYHTYVVQVERRGKLVEFLEKNGIETKIHYPIPIHYQKAAESLGYKKGDFPKTEEMADKILSLPIHQFLREEEIKYVVSKMKEFYKKL
jgi:dTDP-4-amino-4,6-dideoxygalactose transaminase